jgi:membrane-associated protein
MEYLLGINMSVFLQTIGLFGVIVIIFAESGLLIGFFLPGDSLLFTAGFLASQDIFSIVWLIVGCTAAAIVGDNVGYAFGHRIGKKIFTRKESFFFHKDHLMRAKVFYERHGAKTIVFARFVPVVRSFAPIMAGVGDMDYKTFLYYNIIGGTLWAAGFTGLGYVLGSVIPNADRYFFPIVLLVIILSFLPPVIHVLKNKSERQAV